ncbi:AMP-binding protein [Streptomyces sp. NBC_00887]|uniref:AMP-binding protein n=1 Tax=Streptomyces sp. NBC_00887 TaxID=2975859 RepID=UPI002F9116FF|nr:AMP-binding protein [Streptomyces sp. NBC_00887]
MPDQSQHTFTDVVARNVRTTPGKDACVFLYEAAGGRLAADTISYEELDLRARAVAAWIVAHGSAGRPVLVAPTRGRHFAAALLGCLYAGATAVPVDAHAHRAERLLAVVRDCGAELVLAERADAPALTQQLARAGLGDTVCLAIEAADSDAVAKTPPPGPRPDDDALLLYGPGPATAPRGTRLTYRMLAEGQPWAQRVLRSSARSRIGGLLPYRYGTGLIMHLLHPLWLGATGVLVPVGDPGGRPAQWLRAISDFGITTGLTSTYGYQLATERTTDAELSALDLGRWETAVICAAPQQPDVRRAFGERFAAAGFDPEAFVSCLAPPESPFPVAARPVTDSGKQSAARRVAEKALNRGVMRDAAPGEPFRTLVSVGSSVGPELCVAAPDTGAEMAEGRVGVLRVNGLSTGDEAVRYDGELYMSGCLREGIKVPGRAACVLLVHPEDVERSVRESSELCLHGAAFGVPFAPGRDRLVVVQEVRDGLGHDVDLWGLGSGLLRRITTEFEVGPGTVVLVRPGTVRRNFRGRLSRSAVRGMFLSGRLQPLQEISSAEV